MENIGLKETIQFMPMICADYLQISDQELEMLYEAGKRSEREFYFICKSLFGENLKYMFVKTFISIADSQKLTAQKLLSSCDHINHSSVILNTIFIRISSYLLHIINRFMPEISHECQSSMEKILFFSEQITQHPLFQTEKKIKDQ